MSEVWFTSDPHFGHVLMAGLRGFDTVQAHDEAIVGNLKSIITKRDLTWWLGDLCMADPEHALECVREIPGRHRLILGNHDCGWPVHKDYSKYQRRYLEVFESVAPFARIKIARRDVLLSHFPYDADGERYESSRYPQWRLPNRGEWLLHGHTHRDVVWTGEKEIHVGLDAWHNKPVSSSMIARMIAATETMQETGR